jgi:hypothetical protein
MTRDKEYYKIGEWLKTKGYEVNLEDDFWFEDIVVDHKWKDIFDLMLDYYHDNN